MQPAASESSKKASSTNATSRSQSPRNQHGLHRNLSSASHGSSRGREPGIVAAGTLRRASPRSDASGDKEHGDSRSLSSAANNDSDGNHLDYDVTTKSDTPDQSPESGGKALKARTTGSPIVKLPNGRSALEARETLHLLVLTVTEILTHALSHLPPSDLSSASLVSKRFHALITTPHAWRAAFARFFPGQTTIATAIKSVPGNLESFRSDKRSFCRLTALSTWRSEYIIRTRLLRSLARGKPATASATSTPRGFSGSGSAIMMYNSQLFTTANHLDATWGSGLAKNYPRFIHGADEFGQASTSDPTTGKVDNWGLADPQGFRQFSDIYGGTAMYGLGPGEVIGLRNVMEVSQPYGMIYGEGIPDGGIYYRGTDEGRGRFLLAPLGLSEPTLGIPRINREIECISSVWIAKSASVPSLTEGLLGIMVGSSLGVLSAYSLGSQDLRQLRLARGELTARWVLSPGVPIVAIAVDESYSLKRQAQNRIWAVALNALGELFYLTKFPKRQPLARGVKLDGPETERAAWNTGRSVYWNLVEPSRRVARPDPYGELDVNGSYSPRTSWNGMCLSPDQIKAETREIEEFMRKLPKDFRKLCSGWDMRRKLEVDFAGDDGNFAGEAFIVFECGLDEEETAAIRRYTRLKVAENEGTLTTGSSVPTPDDERTPVIERDSIFGPPVPISPQSAPISPFDSRGRGLASMSYSSVDVSPERTPTVEEWRCSILTFGGAKGVQIITTTLDISTYATLTMSEDPAIGMLGSSETSSTLGSPMFNNDRPITPSDLPGQRSRFLAAGTNSGNVYIWDCRSPNSRSVDLVNSIDPIRVIYTDSPEISCIAMTALHVVVGGSDGLVQAWDPLASSLEPIRTLNSRFSSKARRRLAQAQASPAGVGINLYAAGAICLDPDPSVLRGLVSLGTHLRYWSYSALSADQYKGTKRLKRRSERGSNQHSGEYVNVRSSNLKSYIASERHELEQERQRRRRESERLKGRFGIGMMENEEQALAYAALLSEETLLQDEQRRTSQSNTPALSSERFTTPTKELDAEELDADLAEAIRLSLENTPSTPAGAEHEYSPTGAYSPISAANYEVPIRVARKGRRSQATSASRSPPTPLKAVPEASGRQEMDDLEFAMQLSLAEQASRQGVSNSVSDEFPALDGGKGKGKARE